MVKIFTPTLSLEDVKRGLLLFGKKKGGVIRRPRYRQANALYSSPSRCRR